MANTPLSPSSALGAYNATLPTYTDGNPTEVQTDNRGRLLVTSSGAAPVGGGITYTDKTITSLSGSSQTLIAANSSRKSLMFKNGASPVAVNILGGTAAIGGAGCMTFQAYEGFALTGADCPLGAITVIGTAANYIGAFEGT